MRPRAATPPGEHAILFDADCGFCRWSLDKILLWDRGRRLRPVAIQAPEGQELLAPIPEADRLDSWHLVAPDGRIVSAGAALAPLARLLPGGRPLAFLLERLPRTAERAYRLVSENRTRISRLLRIDASCSLRRS